MQVHWSPAAPRSTLFIDPAQKTASGGVLTGESDLRVLGVEGAERVTASSQLIWTSDGGSTMWVPLR